MNAIEKMVEYLESQGKYAMTGEEHRLYNGFLSKARALAAEEQSNPTAPVSLVEELEGLIKGRIGYLTYPEIKQILSRYTPTPDDGGLKERVAQITAHRACHNQEQDLPNGKVAGYCIVCGVPWPCQYAGRHPAQ